MTLFVFMRIRMRVGNGRYLASIKNCWQDSYIILPQEIRIGMSNYDSDI